MMKARTSKPGLGVVGLRTLLAAVSLGCLLTASPAFANPSHELSQIQLAFRDIEVLDKYNKGPIEPTELEVAQSFFDNLHVGVERAKSAYDAITAEDRKRPEVITAKQRIDKLAAYREAFKRNLQAAKSGASNASSQRRAFLTENARFKSSVELFRDASRGLFGVVQAPNAEDIRSALPQLAELDKICRSKYSGIANPPGANSLEDRPADWCQIAAQRQTWIQKTLDAALQSSLKEVENWIAGAQQDVSQDDGFFGAGLIGRPDCVDGVNACQKIQTDRFEARYAAAGLRLDPAVFSPTMNKLQTFLALLEKNGAKLSSPAGLVDDRGIGQTVRTQLRGEAPSVVVKKVGFNAPWGVGRNASNQPMYRTRDGVVLLQIPGQTSCRLARFEYREEYMGGGQYTTTNEVRFRRIRFQTCQ